MKVSDYIVEYLIEKKITDIFGYPGGMVTHFMDSLEKYKSQIKSHVLYHEQGASFAACGYAQSSGKPGVAYATSGPGATNLITGICNAYFDSIPTVFITGQVNTFESKGSMKVRQRGFQETDIISMVKGVTKYAVYAEKPEDIKEYLDCAFSAAMQGRKGPVLLDIPMNVFRSEINLPEDLIPGVNTQTEGRNSSFRACIEKSLAESKRPCFLVGNAVKTAGLKEECRKMVSKLKIPVISSMPSFDILSDADTEQSKYKYGFTGAYGDRFANFILAKSDLVICLGTRLDIRQIGVNREKFAPNAKIIRVDIDEGELKNKVRDDEIQFQIDIKEALYGINNMEVGIYRFADWLDVCFLIKEKLHGWDMQEPNRYVETISRYAADNCTITTDVGQNQVWIAQSFIVKEHQEVLFTGGHGAMGYSLPAAIGAYYGNRRPVICFSGDGGFQMNIQELQVIARENLPIKIIIFNNNALGMIRHFQEMYFEDRYSSTVPAGGYTVPEFTKIAEAYGITGRKINHPEKIREIDFSDSRPELIEILLKGNTYVYPKLEFGRPNQDQEPLMDRGIYQQLMDL